MLNRVAIFVVVVLTGCGSGVDVRATQRESGQPVTRLILISPDTGATAVLDTAESADAVVGEFGPVRSSHGDGRFAYLQGESGVTIVDGGAWTFDHGDHSHYYAQPAAVAGKLDGRFVDIEGRGGLTTARRSDGTVEVIDRARLGEQTVAAAERQSPEDAAVAVAFGDGLVVVTGQGRIESQGQVLGECSGATGAAVLRKSVVLGCRDGAVRVSQRGAGLAALPVLFADTPEKPLGPFGYRRHGASVAAIAGDEVWLLDGRSWQSMRLPGVVAVNTTGGATALALTDDGALHALDVAAGAETARIDLLDEPTGTAVIEVGAKRAYVNDAAAGAVHEIEYTNGLRVTRMHHVSVTPGLMTVAGW